MDFGFLRRVPHFSVKSTVKSPSTWLTLAMILYGILIVDKVCPYIGGSDSSGYYNSARLLSAGNVSTELRMIPGLPVGSPGITPYLYLPLGFRSHGETDMVPTYPVGLPLLMVATSWFVSWFYVPGWVAGWNMFLGVLATYGLGRECGLRPAWSGVAASILALSPLFTSMGLQPMSDVAALTWCTGTIYFALKTRQKAQWGLLCGFALSIAVLIRPTNVLVFLPVLVCLGFSPRRWAWVICGGMPGAVLLGVYNHVAYGKIFTTGYGDMWAAFGREWVWPTLKHYIYWLPRLFTPLIVLALGLFWSRADKRIISVLAVWILSVFGLYSFYMFTRETWWYLRFILPAAPALIIAAMLVLNRLADHFRLRLFEASAPSGHLVITVLLLAVTVAPNIIRLRQLHALDRKNQDQTYWLVADWLNHNVPANSVIATMQHSGSIIAYTPFTMIRWDYISEDNFSPIRDVLQANHQPLYIALYPFEEAEVFARMRGNWKPVVHLFPATIWKYHPFPDGPWILSRMHDASDSRTALHLEREGGIHLQRRLGNGASPHDARGYSGNRGVRRYVSQYHATGGYFRSDSNLDITQDLGARSDEHAAPDLRVSIARLFAGAAQCDFVQQRYVVFHDRGLADDDARAVID